LLALNSYENRVYQVGVDSASPIVAKFYRPNRWDDDAILEEHAFLKSLADKEIPAVAPTSIDGKTLFSYQDFRFSVFPKHGGRSPELDREGVLEWIGRFIARIHSVGALSEFKCRPELNIDTFG
jgi:Ser/Thr protein kinase RdoA (MazF antagonist)